MEGICQQETRSLVKDVKEMSLREEMLRKMLYGEVCFLPLSEVLLIFSSTPLQDLDEVIDLTGSGGETSPHLGGTLKYHCFLSALFVLVWFFSDILEKVVPVYDENIWRLFILV